MFAKALTAKVFVDTITVFTTTTGTVVGEADGLSIGCTCCTLAFAIPVWLRFAFTLLAFASTSRFAFLRGAPSVFVACKNCSRWSAQSGESHWSGEEPFFGHRILASIFQAFRKCIADCIVAESEPPGFLSYLKFIHQKL